MKEISADQLREIKNLMRRVKRNTPMIEKKFRDAGKKPDPWHVFVIAGPWQCLDRLARDSRREARKRAKNTITIYTFS